jgi:general secretion pathway protein D
MQTTAEKHCIHNYRIRQLAVLLISAVLLATAFYTREPIEKVNAAKSGLQAASIGTTEQQATRAITPASAAIFAALLDSVSEDGFDFALGREIDAAAASTAAPDSAPESVAERDLTAPDRSEEPKDTPAVADANTAPMSVAEPEVELMSTPDSNVPGIDKTEPNAPSLAITESDANSLAQTEPNAASEDVPEPEAPSAGIAEPNILSALSLNFQNVPFQTVLEYLSDKTGLVVVSDEPLDGRITVISRQPMSLTEAIALINSVLKERDMAAVRTGRTLRVVTLTKAKTMNLPVTSGNDPKTVMPGDDMVTHIIPIRYADAVNLKKNLQSLLPEYATMEANQEGNALIITDTTANIRRLIEIVQALDTHMAGVAEIMVFHLTLADAASTAELINKIFQQEESQSSQSNQRGGPAAMMEMMMRRPGGRGRGAAAHGGGDSLSTGDSSSTRAGIRVTAVADERTNSVVVSGPSESLEVVAEVIEALDSRSAAAVDVKVFHLEYADADNTAELINEVFGADRSSSRSSSRDDMPMSFRRSPGGGAQDTSSDSSTSTVDVVAAADERTNSIVVTGPADTLEVIAGVIKELDANPEQERQVFVYQLKNAEASNLMEILNNLFREMQSLNEEGASGSDQRFQGQTGRGAAAQPGTSGQTSSSSDLSDEAYFEADDNTNSLLILTSSKNYKKIEPIIEQLDKRLGQVLIKVLFAEVTHTDSLDLGFEFSVMNMRHDGDSTLFSTDFGVASQSDGFNVWAIEGDLTATLRALQGIGKLNVLSRPYILTRDNQTATIMVGEEVPFITDTRTTETGQTINTIQYEDIGIILEVTPSINPDGLVIMEIKPEISTTTAKTVPISETVNAAVFAKRSSETHVEVRSGQTIVIGGLIQDKLIESVKQIPIIGDLPVLGNLFKRTTKEKAKTELLIFLTPIVAMEDDELTAISEAVKNRNTLTQQGMGAELFDLFDQHMEGMRGDVDPNKR